MLLCTQSMWSCLGCLFWTVVSLTPLLSWCSASINILFIYFFVLECLTLNSVDSNSKQRLSRLFKRSSSSVIHMWKLYIRLSSSLITGWIDEIWLWSSLWSALQQRRLLYPPGFGPPPVPFPSPSSWVFLSPVKGPVTSGPPRLLPLCEAITGSTPLSAFPMYYH